MYNLIMLLSCTLKEVRKVGGVRRAPVSYVIRIGLFML
jgi:hypothetical protein